MMSFAFIWLGFESLAIALETMSQSVTMPTGLSFSIMTMLPMFPSFIFFAMSWMVSFEDAETTGLFMMSLTITLVVMFASACSLTGFFTTENIRISAFNYLSDFTSKRVILYTSHSR